jgi:pectin methylesterase-like acyl-CoA thioesterase
VEKMLEEQRYTLFFDFLQKVKPGVLNVVKKPFVLAEDNTVVKASHPPVKTLRVKGKDDTIVIASPYKTSKNDPTHSETRKIIEQNNFANQSLHIIGQQLDRIEEKIDSSYDKIIEKPIPLAVKKDVEKPLISLPEERRGISLKTSSQKNLKKIEEMLLEISLRKAALETAQVPEASSSNISSSINKAYTINHDKGKNVLNVFKHFENESEKSEESSSSESNSSTDEDIKILEQNFGKIDISPKIQTC